MLDIIMVSSILCSRTENGPLVDVEINGGEEELAEAILIMAVKHYLMSQEPLPLRSTSLDNKYVAELDLKCFFFEMNSMSCS